MSGAYTRLKDYARALISYIALEPAEIEEIQSLREELLRMSALVQRMENKQEILWETQKYQSKLNDQAKLPGKERAKEYNPYKW